MQSWMQIFKKAWSAVPLLSEIFTVWVIWPQRLICHCLITNVLHFSIDGQFEMSHFCHFACVCLLDFMMFALSSRWLETDQLTKWLIFKLVTKELVSNNSSENWLTNWLTNQWNRKGHWCFFIWFLECLPVGLNCQMFHWLHNWLNDSCMIASLLASAINI